MKCINSVVKRRLREYLCNRAGGLCEYCQRSIGMAGTVDHYLAQSLGGTNAKANLRWSCVACNNAKADMTPEEWEERRPVLRPKVENRTDRRNRLLHEIAQRQQPTKNTNS